jgi:hypothetical protein
MKKIEELVEFAILLVATETGVSLNYIQKVLLRESLLEDKKVTLKLLKKINTLKAILSFQLRLNYGSCFHRRWVKKLIKQISRRC